MPRETSPNNSAEVEESQQGFISRLARRQKLLASLATAAALAQAGPAIAGSFKGNRKPLGPIYYHLPKNLDTKLHSYQYDLFDGLPTQTVEQPQVSDGVMVQGFDVVVDTIDASRDLKRDEIKIISLHNPDYRKRFKIEGTVTVQPPNGYNGSLYLNPFAADVTNGDFESLGTGSGQLPDMPTAFGQIRYIYGGLRTGPHQFIEVDKYKFKTKYLKPLHKRVAVENSLHLESKEIVPVRFVGNIACMGVAEQITSEVRLTPEMHRRACDYLRNIDAVVPDYIRVFLDYIHDKLEQRDRVNGANKAMILSIPFARKVGGYDVEAGFFDHEGAHTPYVDEVLKAKAEGLSFDPALYSLGRAYRGIVRAMTYRMPTLGEQFNGYDVPANEAGWAAITESFYEESLLGYKDSFDGHPWDNRTEMASSITAVLAVYPEGFIRQYDDLPENKKQSIKIAVQATMDFLAGAGGGYDELEKIIPRYRMIVKALDINEVGLSTS